MITYEEQRGLLNFYAEPMPQRFTLQCTLRMLLNLPLMILRLMIQTSLPYKVELHNHRFSSQNSAFTSVKYFEVAVCECQLFPGLAEAGLISSKLSRHDKKSSSYPDQSPFVFTPERYNSAQNNFLFYPLFINSAFHLMSYEYCYFYFS